MKKTRVVDANVIIRFLLNDHRSLSLKAKSIIVDAQRGRYRLYLDEVVVAEIVWVFSSFYEIKCEDIADRLLGLVTQSWMVNRRKNLIIQALNMYKTSRVDYIDAWLAIISLGGRMPLVTFDRDLEKRMKTRAIHDDNKN